MLQAISNCSLLIYATQKQQQPIQSRNHIHFIPQSPSLLPSWNIPFPFSTVYLDICCVHTGYYVYQCVTIWQIQEFSLLWSKSCPAKTWSSADHIRGMWHKLRGGMQMEETGFGSLRLKGISRLSPALLPSHHEIISFLWLYTLYHGVWPPVESTNP